MHGHCLSVQAQVPLRQPYSTSVRYCSNDSRYSRLLGRILLFKLLSQEPTANALIKCFKKMLRERASGKVRIFRRNRIAISVCESCEPMFRVHHMGNIRAFSALFRSVRTAARHWSAADVGHVSNICLVMG
jgi:hypothetical protein